MATTNQKNAPAPKNATNTAPNTGNVPGMSFDDWEDEQIGFAPYWKPEAGKSFAGIPESIDIRDPEFLRIVFKALTDTECARGPVDGAEKVLVKAGELFTVSMYHSMQEPIEFILANFISKGIPFPVRFHAIKEVPTKKAGQTCWTWRMQLPPAGKKLMAAKREEAAAALMADRAERAALQESNAEN
jgi:hypothetical protein